MPEGYLLSEADLQKLRKLLSEHGMSRVQPQPNETLPGTPEVYVAKVKTDPGSIPALTPKDSDAYDHPGCAMCDIYQIMLNSSDGWDLVPISGMAFPVYNLTTTEIGDDWLLVVRDKSGKWVATVSGGDAVRWGKLDGDLAYNGTATVSLWTDDWSADTTENVTGVKPPPTMTAGTIASTGTTWVRIRRRPDGVWYVDMAPC